MAQGNNQTAADVMNELLGEKVNTKTPVVSVMQNPDEVQQAHEKEVIHQISEEVKTSITNQSNTDYETTVTLPSRGLLYNGKIPAEISLRGMTTRDEKILYASQGDNVFQKILKSCITDPKDIDVNKLVSADELFLVLQLRMITYGPEYRVEAKCPNCGETHTYKIMLNELDINYLDPSFKEPIEIKLPKSGHTVSVKLLRNEDSEFVDRYSKRFAKQFGLSVREVEFSARIAKYIKKINGKDVDFETAIDFVENLMSRDTAQIRSALSKILLGADTNVTVSCQGCGEEFTFNLPLTSEFFRPTFE